MFKISTLLLLAAVGFAQMRGTGGISAGMSQTAGMVGAMASGPVVGADGTAYVVRQTSAQPELVAVNPSNGKINWSLAIGGTAMSEPVLAKDGTILLTTYGANSASNMPMMGTSTDPGAALWIIAPSASSARVQAKVPIDGDMVSPPVITPDGQTIYVIGTTVPAFSTRNQTAFAMTTYLYAFAPVTGTLKFKVQLR